jgi:cold shock protein
MKGIIKKLDAKGFGFIGMDGRKDLFFHANDCSSANFKSLQVNDTVSFEIVDSEKGPKAIHVELVEADEVTTQAPAEGEMADEAALPAERTPEEAPGEEAPTV